MKKLLYILLAAVTFGIAGCTKDPVDIANKIGKAAGLAAEVALDESTREVVVEVAKKVEESSELIVSGNVEDAVNKITKEVVDKFVEEGKLDEDKAKIVIRVGNALAYGLEYLFDNHPDWKSDLELAAKVVSAFTDGALSVLSPLKVSAGANDYDADAYTFIKLHMK